MQEGKGVFERYFLALEDARERGEDTGETKRAPKRIPVARRGECYGCRGSRDHFGFDRHYFPKDELYTNPPQHPEDALIAVLDTDSPDDAEDIIIALIDHGTQMRLARSTSPNN